jgi:hypothetical protein
MKSMSVVLKNLSNDQNFGERSAADGVWLTHDALIQGVCMASQVQGWSHVIGRESVQ